MEYFTNLIRSISRVGAGIGAIFMVGVMLVVVANIIMRIFDLPIFGTYELVELGIVPIGAFAIGYTALQGGHVAMDIVLAHLSPPIRKMLTIPALLLSLGIWIAIAWAGITFASGKLLTRETTIILQWPAYPFRFILSLGVIILCLVLLIDLIRAIREITVKGARLK